MKDLTRVAAALVDADAKLLMRRAAVLATKDTARSSPIRARCSSSEQHVFRYQTG
jgi:hypothetical protein